MVPSNTTAVGPVIITGWPSPAHDTESLPPGNATVTESLSQPREIP